MPTRKILKIIARFLVAGGMVLAAILALTLYIMARKDKEHARFYNTGKSVNAFLNDYQQALEDSFRQQEVSETMAFYSDRYASPARVRWLMMTYLSQRDVASLDFVSD